MEHNLSINQTMKKLIDIPVELIKPLKQMAVENELSFHAQIIWVLKIAVEANKSSSFLK